MPKHLLGLSLSSTVESLEAQLRLLFGVQPPAQLLLFKQVEHDGATQWVSVHPVEIVHEVGLYYAVGEDADFLPPNSTVFVECTQPNSAAPGSAQAESMSTRPSSTTKPAPSISNSSGQQQRLHKAWKADSDKTWALHIPR